MTTLIIISTMKSQEQEIKGIKFIAMENSKKKITKMELFILIIMSVDILVNAMLAKN